MTDITDFVLPTQQTIRGAIVDPNRPSYAQVRGTESTVKVWFLQSQPYETSSLEAFLARYAPGVTPEQATIPGSDGKSWKDRFNECTAINQSFTSLSGLSAAVIEAAMAPFEKVANVRFVLAQTEAEADIRIGAANLDSPELCAVRRALLGDGAMRQRFTFVKKSVLAKWRARTEFVQRFRVEDESTTTRIAVQRVPTIEGRTIGDETKSITIPYPLHMARIRTLRKAMCQLMLFVLPLIPLAGYGATWVIEETDEPDAVSEARIDELEKQALAGDTRLREEFAAAYLELRDPRFGCKRLKYGYRCRAMGKRTGSGQKFLIEILDSEPKNESEKYRIGSFQFRYAMLRYAEAAPTYDQETDACKHAVRYYELAVGNKDVCVANDLILMTRLGHCMPKSKERAQAYRARIPSLMGCPKI